MIDRGPSPKPAIITLVVIALSGAMVWLWPAFMANLDPRAYQGSSTGHGMNDIARLTRVELPDCAKPLTRYYILPEGPESVSLDFAAPDDCVDSFLVSLGVRPDQPDPLMSEYALIYAPDGANWTLSADGPVRSWRVVLPGLYREQVDVTVDRGARPARVFLHAFAID
ncbi:hypothetical protein [Actinokineospora diospyrosa]|uniref:Uncharacterized protein n=1 Tax=Actinokineospora diospyrosa TaxID=103728 RepID=A0ABT1IM45_9PSEU|nr:hypothetical protein [Actinokineospora diospyrosa]MCP2273710.1 hypothetical protein [Actinokineospora diospyrosa]